MHWVHERPTEDGYYWIRRESAGPGQTLVLAEIEGELTWVCGLSRVRRESDNPLPSDTWFYGPIPEPPNQ